ncbi:IclR family transcriptional regulator [Nocardioides sp. CFH 31398]|uniref:IclR family transcriptional regulator n=1 Tax=Nocardioides sp. CFH 31398 TaxID=2919579 RepID=UPI001F06EC3C|nr:IclR family transcriptional regulator [Nocardioides sp. CFH 31398]MCH1866792.1 IclR family transcriptional regulator [Nocardioides sp. CFH 31398]
MQSLHRALDLVEMLASRGGAMTIADLAAATGTALPTAHRLLGTLRARGYVRQLPDRRYALGFRLVPLGATAGSSVGVGAERALAGLVEELGETANLAVLDGDRIAYVAQVPGRHSMRMFTEVGRRVDPHCTAVGKAIMARMPRERARALLTRTGMAPRTPHTLTDLEELCDGLDEIERLGYAMDEEEQEVGVRCVAVVVPTEEPRVAISVSGPAPRMTDGLVGDAVPLLRRTAQELAAALI